MRTALIALTASVALGCASAQSNKPNDHSTLVKELERDGHIVVDSASNKPVELPYEAIGRIIICMRADQPHVSIHHVQTRMFKPGTFSILVWCRAGLLITGEGYL